MIQFQLSAESQRTLRLLSNSSEKSLFFDVLKVTFRYLRVEDEQGSSAVVSFQAKFTAETQRTRRLRREKNKPHQYWKMPRPCHKSTAWRSMKPIFDIVAEPRAKTYVDLLDFAAARCESFSLVWRDQLRFEHSAYEIKHDLKPFLLSNIRTDEWPGTKLIGHEAIVRRYRVSDESVKLLHRAPGLYSWLQPKLPEDLAFYSSGDVLWLASISHEGVACFFDPDLKTAEIFAYAPGIKIREHKGRASYF